MNVPTEAACRAQAAEIGKIAYETVLYAPLEVAVEKAVRAGGPSRDEIRAQLLALRYGEARDAS